MSTLLVLIHQPLKMPFEKFHKCVSMIAKKSFEHDETSCIKSIVAFMFLKAQILNEFVHFGSITEMTITDVSTVLQKLSKCEVKA